MVASFFCVKLKEQIFEIYNCMDKKRKKQIAIEELFKTYDLPMRFMWKALYSKIHKIYEEGTFTKLEVLEIAHHVIRAKAKRRYDLVAEYCSESSIKPERNKFNKVDKFEDFLKTSVRKILD